MIVLRNMMLAVAAFFVAGYGFYFYLIHAMPPDKLQTMAVSDTATAGTAAPAADPATSSASTLDLVGAVLGDFLAANRRDQPAGESTSGFPADAPAQVPEWLDQRFDQEAANAGKTLTPADKSGLLATLLELRQMKLQQLATSAATPPQTAPSGTPDWSLTARAMQAELQFRQTLGIGLAEFMKKLDHAELQRVLALSPEATAAVPVAAPPHSAPPHSAPASSR